MHTSFRSPTNSPYKATRRLPLLTLLPLLLAACTNDEESLPENPTPADLFRLDPLAVERGRALYEGSCANFCHGVEGVNAAVDLFDCQWQYGSADEELFAIITDGIPDTRMVGFGENFPEGEDDTWRLIAFLRSSQQNCAVNEPD